MKISSVTPTQVWGASSRSLTNFGSSALAGAPTVFTSIAGASNVDLRTSVGIIGQTTVSVLTGAGATANITVTHYDGANNITLAATAAAAASPAAFSGVNNNTVGMRINNNDATHAGNYMVTQALFTI